MKYVICALISFTQGGAAFATTWEKADFSLYGSVLDFVKAKESHAFTMSGSAWLKVSGSGYAVAKLVVNGKNYNCDGAGWGYDPKKDFTKFYCLLNLQKYIDLIQENAKQGLEFEKFISVIESYFASMRDKRVMVLLGHDSSSLSLATYEREFLEPKEEAYQATIISEASQLKDF